MNIENCSQFALRKMKKQKSRSSAEEIAIEEEKFIKKALIFMLWNKKRLAALVQNPKNAISQSSTMISAYITALVTHTHIIGIIYTWWNQVRQLNHPIDPQW